MTLVLGCVLESMPISWIEERAFVKLSVGVRRHRPTVGEPKHSYDRYEVILRDEAAEHASIHVDAGHIVAVEGRMELVALPGRDLSEWVLAAWAPVRIVASAADLLDYTPPVAIPVTGGRLNAPWSR